MGIKTTETPETTESHPFREIRTPIENNGTMRSDRITVQADNTGNKRDRAIQRQRNDGVCDMRNSVPEEGDYETVHRWRVDCYSARLLVLWLRIAPRIIVQQVILPDGKLVHDRRTNNSGTTGSFEGLIMRKTTERRGPKNEENGENGGTMGSNRHTPFCRVHLGHQNTAERRGLTHTLSDTEERWGIDLDGHSDRGTIEQTRESNRCAKPVERDWQILIDLMITN